VTLRDETEWIETVELGWNKLAGAVEDKIIKTVENFQIPQKKSSSIYGDGAAGKHICELLRK
jgi:UDP-N-acetylglucosamine 2-epimerase